MSHEREASPAEVPKPEKGFGFTEQEKLYNRVSDARFWEILDDPRTAVHEVHESSNDFGEFLFVTLSRSIGKGKRELITLYGYGFHEHRERWFLDYWDWYRANQFPDMMQKRLSKPEARELIRQRRAYIAPFATEAEPQSEHGKLFEFLADLTDDDGALAELEDLGDVAYWLLGDID